MYGEGKFVVMFGGLHIEMAALRTMGDWLQSSSRVEALVQAEITTAGTADSFLCAAHVARTRRAHQLPAAALYILQYRAYNNRDTDTEDEPLGFHEWCSKREESCPQFQYLATVMPLELCLLDFVRSQRQSSFSMYLDALTELVPWFFALDHTGPEELGNAFEEESEDLLVLDNKKIADPSAVEVVKKAQKINQQQFQPFTKECLRSKITQSTAIG